MKKKESAGQKTTLATPIGGNAQSCLFCRFNEGKPSCLQNPEKTFARNQLKFPWQNDFCYSFEPKLKIKEAPAIKEKMSLVKASNDLLKYLKEEICPQFKSGLPSDFQDKLADLELAAEEARGAGGYMASFDDIMEPPKRGPGVGIWIRTIGGACPCQADGTINGHPFYARARGGTWTLDIVPGGEDPVFPDEPKYHAEGNDKYGGYMPELEMLKIIFKHSMAFLKKVKI